jgi:NTE family protein
VPRPHVGVELALQGGGSHGAFTWGVLDRLLEEDRIEVAGLSGASAGAINAVVLASGLLDGGRVGAQRALAQFWSRVADASALSPSGWSVFGALVGDMMTRLMSPYQFNPFNVNPLRQILVAEVDFERLRAHAEPRIYVSATRVATGELRVFSREELGADNVLASACLPTLFHAVRVDGHAYWDGGYVGNPALLPLVRGSPAHDLIVVQINPVLREEVPGVAHDIVERINEISFNSSLMHEVRTIALLKKVLDEDPGAHHQSLLFRQIQSLRLHRIHGDEALVPLGAHSKLRTGRSFLERLFHLGRSACDAWLSYHRKDLGRRSTLDLSEYLA